MSIRARLYITAIVAALIVCGVSFVGLYADRSLQQALARMEMETIPLIDQLHTLRFAALRVVSSTNEHALVQVERRAASERSVTPGTDTDEIALRNAAAVAFMETLQSFAMVLARVRPDQQELAARIALDGRELIDGSAQVLDAIGAGADSTTVLTRRERLELAEQNLLATLEKALAEYASVLPNQSAAARTALDSQVRTGLVLLLGVALVVMLLIAWTGRDLSASLERLNNAAAAVAAGGAEQVHEFSRGVDVDRLASTVNRMAAEARKHAATRTVSDAIIASLPNALLVTDSKLVITRANPPALKLLGATDAMQVVGRKLSEVSVDIAAPAQRVKNTLVPTSFETSVVKRAGAPVPVTISLSPLTGVPDQSRGLVCLAEDIRDRREAERLLIEARDRAQLSDRGKSEFLATMSHEARTPLNAIIGYSQMLQENISDPDSLEDLRRIETAGSELLRTVDRVRELADAESGKTVLTLEPFPVAALVAEVRSEYEGLAGRRGNTLRIAVSPDVGTMVADRVKIRQVLTNLVGNACKFTERGTIALSVTRIEEDGKPWVAFEVNDTGIGMNDEQMTSLFTPFDPGAGRRYGGTGLGLALANRFCRMMSGSIDVSSAPGRGSCFTVRLPIVVPSVVLAA